MKLQHISATVTAVILVAAPVVAQSSVQQGPGTQAPAVGVSPELVSACVDAQESVAALAAQVNVRLEEARQTNRPQEMRAALADLQAALVEIRTRAAQCSPLVAAAQAVDPHAGHAMTGGAQKRMTPVTPIMQPGSTAPAPGAPDPHAGHTTPAAPKAPAAAPSAKPGAKPTDAPKPADPHAAHGMKTKAPSRSAPSAKAADPHAGHDKTKRTAPARGGETKGTRPEAQEIRDPVCNKPVDPKTAPSTTYKGATYYFCSAADRLKFIRNPESYLKKKEAGRQ